MKIGHIIPRILFLTSGGNIRRLLREKQQLKIPQEAVFASEEAEALPAESEVYFRSGM